MRKTKLPFQCPLDNEMSLFQYDFPITKDPVIDFWLVADSIVIPCNAVVQRDVIVLQLQRAACIGTPIHDAL